MGDDTNDELLENKMKTFEEVIQPNYPGEKDNQHL